MFQVIDPDKLKDINPDLLIVQADSQELLDNKLKNTPVWTSLKAVQNNKVIYADYSTYMLGFGIVSQEAIMKQISDEWGLNWTKNDHDGRFLYSKKFNWQTSV